jgi:hypothetical protein
MIPLHEIVIKITQPANNYTYTAIISEQVGTTSKLLGTCLQNTIQMMPVSPFNVLSYIFVLCVQLLIPIIKIFL